MTKRELVAAIICNAIAFILLASLPFKETSVEIVVAFIGGISCHLLGRLSWVWLDMLPRRKRRD